MSKFNRFMLVALLAVVLVLTMGACTSDGVREQGADAVNTVLFTNTDAEKAVQDFFCEPGNLSNPDCK